MALPPMVALMTVACAVLLLGCSILVVCVIVRKRIDPTGRNQHSVKLILEKQQSPPASKEEAEEEGAPDIIPIDRGN